MQYILHAEKRPHDAAQNEVIVDLYSTSLAVDLVRPLRRVTTILGSPRQLQ